MVVEEGGRTLHGYVSSVPSPFHSLRPQWVIAGAPILTSSYTSRNSNIDWFLLVLYASCNDNPASYYPHLANEGMTHRGPSERRNLNWGLPGSQFGCLTIMLHNELSFHG